MQLVSAYPVLLVIVLGLSTMTLKAGSDATAQAERGSLVVTVSLSVATVAPGKAVPLTVRIENTTKRECSILWTELMIEFEVTKSNGTHVGRSTKYQERLKRAREAPSLADMPLKAGEKKEFGIDLQALYPLDEPGTYQVRAKLVTRIDAQREFTNITSETVEVVVK
jgi:hypothetical protein